MSRLRAALLLGTALLTAAASTNNDFDWSSLPGSENSVLGASLAGAGDVDGDGYDDLIVGAPFTNLNGPLVGAACIYRGGASGLSVAPAWTLSCPQSGVLFGESVAGAGDLNGDGYADLAVGGVASGPNASLGAVFVYYGGPSGPPALPSWTGRGGGPSAPSFGSSVCPAGDVNGDGFGDLLVGALYDGAQREGKAYVYHGSATGLAAQPAWSGSGDHAFSLYGEGISGIGDIDGDGWDDVAVGAPDSAIPQPLTNGAVRIYRGGAGGLSASPAWTIAGSETSSFFGAAVAGAGDIDGDGFPDLAIGVPWHSGALYRQGAVMVYRGGAGGPTPAWSIEGPLSDDAFGNALSISGDVNGDGYSDLVIGGLKDASFPVMYPGPGFVQLHYGGAGGLSLEAAWTFDGIHDGMWFGSRTSFGGDFNGDQLSDIVFGAPNEDSLPSYDNGGAAHAVYGSRQAPEPPASLAQFGFDGATPVPAGGTIVEYAFLARAIVADPDSSRARIQVQACPVDEAFPEEGGTISGFFPNGSNAWVWIDGLSRGVDYHWRARSVDSIGNRSAWVDFGSDPGEPDIRILVDTAPVLKSPRQVLGGRALAPGAQVDEKIPLRFVADLEDANNDWVRIEVERRAPDEPFTGVASAVGGFYPGGEAYCMLAPAPGPHRWRGRAVDETGRAGPWIDFGGNGAADADFIVMAAGSGNGAASCQVSGAVPPAPGLALLLPLLLALRRTPWHRQRGRTRG